jgi:hypothetical protein
MAEMKKAALVALKNNLVAAEVAIVAAQDARLALIAALEEQEQSSQPPPLFSQRDPRWANQRLGTSDKTIGSHGCVVTCLAMILCAYGLDETPASANEQLTARRGYHNTNLVIWESVQRIWPSVNFAGKLNCITTPAPIEEINRRLAQGYPVIAWLDFDERPGTQQHFVLLLGILGSDYAICDPWTGEHGTLVKEYAQDVPGKSWLKTAAGIIQGVRYYEPAEGSS